MILIYCVDNQGGIPFNHRRQSQDRLLRARILEKTAHSRLWMSPYSAKQFQQETGPQVSVSEHCLEETAPGEYCFLETPDLPEDLGRIQQVILYRWNRDYPADVFCPLDFTRFQRTAEEEFAGSSHKTITEEIYIPCEP